MFKYIDSDYRIEILSSQQNNGKSLNKSIEMFSFLFSLEDVIREHSNLRHSQRTRTSDGTRELAETEYPLAHKISGSLI